MVVVEGTFITVEGLAQFLIKRLHWKCFISRAGRTVSAVIHPLLPDTLGRYLGISVICIFLVLNCCTSDYTLSIFLTDYTIFNWRLTTPFSAMLGLSLVLRHLDFY